MVLVMEKHLFKPNGRYINRETAIEKQELVKESVLPLVNQLLDEGYPLSEILHFIIVTTEFEIYCNYLKD